MSAQNSPKALSGTDHLFAGAISGIITRLIVSPLDVLKIRLQLQAHGGFYTGFINALYRIIRDEGIFALWKGNLTATMMSSPYTAITIATQKSLKKIIPVYNHGNNINNNNNTVILHKYSLPPMHPLHSALCGGLAGMLATTITYPFDLLRSRFIAQRTLQTLSNTGVSSSSNYTSLYDACRHIVKKSGFRGFYDGLSPAVFGIFPYMATQFCVYDLIQRYALLNLDMFEKWGYNIVNKAHNISNTITPNNNLKYTNLILNTLGFSYFVDTIDQHNKFTSSPEVTSPLSPSSHLSSDIQPQTSSIPLWVAPLAGLLSGISGKAISFPFDLVKRRMQIHHFPATFDQEARPITTKPLQIVKSIFRNEGFFAFYKGLVPALIKSGPSAALSFTMYEWCIKTIVKAKEIGQISTVH